MVKLTIDGKEVEARKGQTILEVAHSAGIYIPTLCYHPDLPPGPGLKSSELAYYGKELIEGQPSREFEGCKLCVVKIEGKNQPVLACSTPVEEDMVAHTDSEELKAIRREALTKILADHPHACLLCEEKEGCDRIRCSLNVPEEERCCEKLGNCELQRVAEYLRVEELTIPRYRFKNLPTITDEPLLIRDYNLCIGCLRCVRVCREVRGVGSLTFAIREDGKVIVGTGAPSLRDSNCRFCSACVEVCPAGALRDKKKVVEREALVACRYTCPARIDVPLYVRLISEEKFAEASSVIREKVPFPLVLGYVCHHPCEDECRRGQVNEPIAICALKRFAAEHDIDLWKERFKAAESNGKKVAIVGSGPTGLTAAYSLAKLGHSVIIFESMPEIGGMMRYGIPDFRLPRDVLQRDLDDIMSLGLNMEIKTNTTIGRDASLQHLRENYDAVLIAIGNAKGKAIKVEGVDLEGVYVGIDFLKDVKLGKMPKVRDKVVVIGGGNVAMDAAMTSLRLGAKEVQLFCLESRNEMPAFKWRVEEAEDEGIEINPSWGVKRVIGNGRKVAAVELIRCISVFDKEGKFRPVFDESTTKVMETDMVIFAIGQEPDVEFLRSSGIRVKEGNLIDINPDTFMTNIDGVFAAGEAIRGPASVVEAIADGRKVAMSIDRYLNGKGGVEEKLVEVEKPSPWLGEIGKFAELPRVKMPCLLPQERVRDFSLIELGFDEKMAIQEANRCLRCDLRLYLSTPPLPPERLIELTEANVMTVSELEGVYELYDEKKRIIYIKGTANLRKELVEQLRTIPEARFFRYEEEPMYTRRESELLQKFIQKHGKMPKYNIGLIEELY